MADSRAHASERVRAKFFVQKIEYTRNSGATVTLHPVVRGEENKEWSKHTPGGELRMMILNDAATAFFRDLLDDESHDPEVYIEITRAE